MRHRTHKEKPQNSLLLTKKLFYIYAIHHIDTDTRSTDAADDDVKNYLGGIITVKINCHARLRSL